MFKNVVFLFFRANWVKFNGTTFKPPCALVIGSGEFPVFGKLLSVYVIKHKPLFHVQVLKTLELSTHFHCYVVELSPEELYVPASDLVSYLPLHLHTFPGQRHVRAIVPKHRMLTVD